MEDRSGGKGADMKKVIVTGANGFIGTALLRYMSGEGVRIYAIVKDENEYIDDIKALPGVEVVYCSLENISALPSLIFDRDIDACIHLAWAGSFGAARADYTMQTDNVLYAMKTVEAVSAMNIKRFVCAGTLAEKDVLNYHLTDGATPNAVSIYGIAKNYAHLMTKTLCTSLGIEHIWCYLSNTYGVGNTTNNFVNMAVNLMLDGKSADFTTGEQSYDFVYITDTVRAIYAAADKGKANVSYYLGSGKAMKLKDYICLIRDAVDKNIEIHLGAIPYNGKPLPTEAYDSSKLMRDSGFKASVPFEEGIKLTVEWLRKIRSKG